MTRILFFSLFPFYFFDTIEMSSHRHGKKTLIHEGAFEATSGRRINLCWRFILLLNIQTLFTFPPSRSLALELGLAFDKLY